MLNVIAVLSMVHPIRPTRLASRIKLAAECGCICDSLGSSLSAKRVPFMWIKRDCIGLVGFTASRPIGDWSHPFIISFESLSTTSWLLMHISCPFGICRFDRLPIWLTNKLDVVCYGCVNLCRDGKGSLKLHGCACWTCDFNTTLVSQSIYLSLSFFLYSWLLSVSYPSEWIYSHVFS